MSQFHISKEDKIRAQKEFSTNLESLRSKLPRNVLELVSAVLHDTSSDTDVIVDPQETEKYITPNQAASILHASRPWVRKLIKEGKLRSHKIGAHFRLNIEDVMALKNEWDIQRKEESKKLHSSINTFLEETGWDD